MILLRLREKQRRDAAALDLSCSWTFLQLISLLIALVFGETFYLFISPLRILYKRVDVLTRTRTISENVGCMCTFTNRTSHHDFRPQLCNRQVRLAMQDWDFIGACQINADFNDLCSSYVMALAQTRSASCDVELPLWVYVDINCTGDVKCIIKC